MSDLLAANWTRPAKGPVVAIAIAGAEATVVAESWVWAGPEKVVPLKFMEPTHMVLVDARIAYWSLPPALGSQAIAGESVVPAANGVSPAQPCAVRIHTRNIEIGVAVPLHATMTLLCRESQVIAGAIAVVPVGNGAKSKLSTPSTFAVPT